MSHLLGWICPPASVARLGALATAATVAALLWLVNAASAQSIVDERRDDIDLVIRFSELYKAPDVTTRMKMKRLAKEIEARGLIGPGELVNIKESSASLDMSLFVLVGIYSPSRPWHLQTTTDRGPVDMLIYEKNHYFARYLNYYFVQNMRVVGYREADLSQPFRDDGQPNSYNGGGLVLDDIWCAPWAFTEIRCADRSGNLIEHAEMK